MDWRIVIPVAITLGLALVGGIWSLVQLVAKLVSEATEVKVRLDLFMPVAADMPQVKQSVAIHEHRIGEAEDEIDSLRGMAGELAALKASKRH